MIFRRTADHADFVWAVSLNGKPPLLSVLAATPGEISIAAGKTKVTVSTRSPSVRVE
jgi:hypothetical protein